MQNDYLNRGEMYLKSIEPSIRTDEFTAFKSLQTLSNITNTGSLAVDNKSIVYDNRNIVSVNLKKGCLTTTDEGIDINTNSENFKTEDGILDTIVPLTYLSPYVVFKSGTPTLNQYTAIVRGINNKDWACAYNLIMVNSSGIVKCAFELVLDRESTADVGTHNNKNQVGFTFVINTSGSYVYEHSRMSNTTILPSNLYRYLFMPKYTNFNTYGLAAKNQNWYVSTNIVNCVEYPFFAYSETFIWVSPKYEVFIARNGGNPPTVAISFAMETSGNRNWYDTTRGKMYTGQLFFNYISDKTPTHDIL